MFVAHIKLEQNRITQHRSANMKIPIPKDRQTDRDRQRESRRETEADRQTERERERERVFITVSVTTEAKFSRTILNIYCNNNLLYFQLKCPSSSRKGWKKEEEKDHIVYIHREKRNRKKEEYQYLPQGITSSQAIAFLRLHEEINS